jgi:hypothetical protein
MSKLTLIPTDEISELLNTDSTDESVVSLLSFSVTTEIEKYCNRILVNREILEFHSGYTSNSISSKEYPVTEFASLQIKDSSSIDYQIISPDLYGITPSPGISSEPVEVELVNGYLFPRGKNNIKLTYTAGYLPEEVPQDLKMAFCEILSWMLKRLKARQIGVNTLARAKNQSGPLLYDPNIPEHARQILDSYRRKGY